MLEVQAAEAGCIKSHRSKHMFKFSTSLFQGEACPFYESSFPCEIVDVFLFQSSVRVPDYRRSFSFYSLPTNMLYGVVVEVDNLGNFAI